MPRQPSLPALVAEGEPGIGKTTLCLSAIEFAEERGFLVLSARPAEAESVLAYASLADLLSGVDSSVLTDLPTPQRLAIDRVLLRAEAEDLTTDQRAVGAGFLSVIELLAEKAPVLVAVDDLQWLDPSSRNVIAFAARRLSARVGVFGTVRTDPDEARRCGVLAAVAATGRRAAGADPAAEPRRFERRHHPAARTLAVAAGNRSDTGGFGRQPVLRPRIGARDGR